MAHHAILKWAAGADIQLTPPFNIDEAELLRLIDLHNLSGRFLDRVGQPDQPVFSREFREKLVNLHDKTNYEVRRNISAIGQIKAALGANTAFIVIKGISSYVLSGEERVMRAGDIDALTDNPRKLIDTLLTMNFRQTRAPFLHELGEYSKDDVEIDIHDYFPVYSYAHSIVSADLRPAANPSVWHQSHTSVYRKITYEHLAANSFSGENPQTPDIFVADPNILAIIICSHAFMNYTNLWSISYREKVYVRLGELADLFDLAKHPRFDKEKFAELIEKFKAVDAVSWAMNMADFLIGQNPLPDFEELIVDREHFTQKFPRCLWWNFWAALNFETDELIQDQWLSMDKVVGELGFNSISAQSGKKLRFGTRPSNESILLERLITLQEAPLPMSLEINPKGLELQIRLYLKIEDSSDKYRFRIDFGQIAGEIVYSPADRKLTVVGCEMKADVHNTEDQAELKFTFALENLKQRLPNLDRLSLLIGVARQNAAGQLTDSTLIPLVID